MIKSLLEKGFFHLLATKFLTQFLGFGTVLLVAKFLTPVELGEVNILQSYTRMFVLLAGFGMSSAVLKQCAENRPQREREGILRHGIIRSTFTVLIALTVVEVAALAGVITSSHRLSRWLMVYVLVIPPLVYMDTMTSFLVALKKIKEMANAQAIIKIQSVFLIVLATWLWGFPGFVYTTIAVYVLGLLPLIRHVGLRFITIRDIPAPKGFMSISVLSMLANLINILGQYGDIVILDHFSTDRTSIGYYSLATLFVLGAMQVTATVQSIATPYFSERAHERDWSRLALIRNQLRMSALSIVVAVGIYGIAALMILVFYGPVYKPTLLYLSILLIKYVLWSSCAIIGVSLFGQGLVHYNVIIASIATPLGLILTYFMLQISGIPGVAWAQVIRALFILVLYLFTGRYVLSKPLSNNEIHDE